MYIAQEYTWKPFQGKKITGKYCSVTFLAFGSFGFWQSHILVTWLAKHVVHSHCRLSLVYKTPTVCIDPSGDSGGGGFSEQKCKVTCVMAWSRFTAMRYLLRPENHLWLEAAGSTFNLTVWDLLQNNWTWSSFKFFFFYGYKERRWIEPKTSSRHYVFISGSVLVKARNIFCVLHL